MTLLHAKGPIPPSIKTTKTKQMLCWAVTDTLSWLQSCLYDLKMSSKSRQMLVMKLRKSEVLVAFNVTAWCSNWEDGDTFSQPSCPAIDRHALSSHYFNRRRLCKPGSLQTHDPPASPLSAWVLVLQAGTQHTCHSRSQTQMSLKKNWWRKKLEQKEWRGREKSNFGKMEENKPVETHSCP